MFNKNNFCHVASNNRNEQKAGLFVYKTTDDLDTVLASGYFNEKIIDINLHDVIIHVKTDPTDKTKVQQNVLCVTERTLDNVGTKVVLSQWEGEAETDLTEIEAALTTFVKKDGSSIMTGPLKFKAGSFEGAIAGGLGDGISIYKLKSDGSIDSEVASLTKTNGFVPGTTNTMSIGSHALKWKDLHVNGKVYAPTINNGSDLAVPNPGQADTIALKSQVDLAANSGRMITPQGFWYAKMESGTVPPAAEDGTNYADFSQVDGNGDPIIVTYNRVSGAWVQDQTITPPVDYDGYVPITSKIWDIPEQAGQQGGRVLWNHQSKEFTPYPQIVSFEDIEVTGQSTVIIPNNPVNNQIVNKNYVDEAIAAIPTPTVDIVQSIDAEIVGTLTVADNGDVSGFSNSNYLLFPGDLDMTGANSFEIVASFTTSVNGLLVYLLAENPVSILSDKHLTFMASTHIRFDVNDGSNYQTLEGTTSLLANTKYYAKLTYDGTNYTLSLSTDGINYTTEVTAAAQYIPGKITYEYLIGRASVATQLHLSDYYIKKNGILVWQGLGDPGLHQRVSKAEADYVVETQIPTAANSHTWYRKYKSGWVEQGGIGPVVAASGTATVTFPITMSDTNYTALTGICDAGAKTVGIMTKTTTGITLETYAVTGTSNIRINWEVKGMAA